MTITKAGMTVLTTIYAAAQNDTTAVLPNGAALRKLERDGLVERAEDGWWTLTVDGMIAYCEAADIHHVRAIEVTLDNGAVVYRSACMHGWETGFHYSAEDSDAVALGHGSVDRPLYVKPVQPVIDAQPFIAEREQAAREQYRALTLTDVLPAYGRTEGDVTRQVSSSEVKRGFWNCCMDRPAYAMAFTDDDGSEVWHGACVSCAGTVAASRLAQIAPVVRLDSHTFVPEIVAAPAVEDIPQPFRTRSKVKNTRAARRFRKGA